MAQPAIKTSFASGEWAPKLRSRVDVAKYHSGAALLRNFYVDYSGGGASTRQGTKFINQCKANGARLIPFQPSTTISYVLEFGQNYIRFISAGAYILETAVAIQSITGSPVTVNSTANGYSNGDWVFINSAYYIVTNAAANTYQLTDLFGNSVTTLTGTQAQRVYTITSPYATSDLFSNPTTQNPGLKFAPDVTSLIICHPTYAPQILTINSANSWTLTAINFGPTISTPTNLAIVSSDTGGTTWYYSYLITAVDTNGQESAPTSPVVFAGTNYIGDNTQRIANTLSWTATPGAQSYNIYKASPTFKTTTTTGAQYGFIGNVTGTSFLDSYPGISPDFSQTQPISENPFQGAGVASYTVNVQGTYTTVPTVTVGAAPAGGTRATAVASLGIISLTNFSGGTNFVVGNIYNLLDTANNLALVGTITCTSIGGGGTITNGTILWAGSITAGNTPSNSLRVQNPISLNGSCDATWGVTQVLMVQSGAGYTSAPAVSFSAGAATATATLATASGGNPGVPSFIQERLTLAGQPQAIQSFNMSQPNSFFNFNISNPSQDDDAISGTIISEELNDIRSLIPVPGGLIALTGKGAWLLNGTGTNFGQGASITPLAIFATPQAFNGANDLRPIKINFDVLYGTNKGNYIRDLSYNLYASIYTGSDISVLANHLFFGFYLVDWAWSEEPFKTLWAVRNDGQLLSLGYVKEQELTGWAHHDTNGQFLSVCSVIETVNGNVVDAVYVIVQRIVNGTTVQYVERMADRYFPYGYEDSWSVDCALQTQAQSSPTGTLTITGDPTEVGNVVTLSDTTDAPFTAAMATNNWIVRAGGGIYKITVFTSTSLVTATVVRAPSLVNTYTDSAFPVTVGFSIWQPTTTVTGLTQLIGASVTGVADGTVVPATVVSATGSVTLATAATKITLGLAYTADLQTLPLDLGEPTVQGKRKKITALTLRVADTLGLQAGKTFSTLVNMKDFTIGNVPTTSTGVASVTDLVNGDGRTIIDQEWDSAGNYCVRQNLPYPATILGVMPEVTVGDTK